jgi:hypothetical protein
MAHHGRRQGRIRHALSAVRVDSGAQSFPARSCPRPVGAGGPRTPDPVPGRIRPRSGREIRRENVSLRLCSNFVGLDAHPVVTSSNLS